SLDLEASSALTLDPVSFNNLVFPLLPSLRRSRAGVPLADYKGTKQQQRQQDRPYQPVRSHGCHTYPPALSDGADVREGTAFANHTSRKAGRKPERRTLIQERSWPLIL